MVIRLVKVNADLLTWFEVRWFISGQWNLVGGFDSRLYRTLYNIQRPVQPAITAFVYYTQSVEYLVLGCNIRLRCY